MPGSRVHPAAAPDAFCFVYDPLAVGDDLQVPSEHFQGNEDGVLFGPVDSLDQARQGPGRGLMAPCPESARRPPKVWILGPHSRGVGEDELLARELALPWFAAVRLLWKSWGAVARGWRRQEPALPQTPWLPIRGLPLGGQLPAMQAPEGVPSGTHPPPVQCGLPGVLAQGAARVGVVTRPGVTVPGPGAPGEDARVFAEGGVLPRSKGCSGAPEGGLLVYMC